MSETPATTFSTRRAWKHVGLVVLVLVAAGAGASPWVKDPARFGEGLGRLLLVVGGATFGLSYLWQTGRRRRAVGLAVALVGGLAALTAVLVGQTGRAERPLIASDTAPLVRDGGRLRHPTLGFSFALPAEGYTEFTDEARRALANAFAGRKDVTGWAWRGAGIDSALIMLIKDAMNSKEALEGIAAGFKRSLGQSAELKLLDEHSQWDAEEHSVLFVIGMPSGDAMAVRFLAGPSVTVGIMASAADAASARQRVDTLTL